MPTLFNPEIYSGTATGEQAAVVIPRSGRYKLSADIPAADAAAFTFTERSAGGTQKRPIEKDAAAVSLVDGSAAVMLWLTAGSNLYVTRTGGTASCSVRLELLEN